MPVPFGRIMPGDWIGLNLLIQEIYSILNADTTLSDLLTPPGSDGEVIYNKDGVYGADSTHTFNDTTKVETVQEISVTQKATVGTTAYMKRVLAGGVTD